MKFILCTLIGLITLTSCTEKNKSFSQSEITILPKPASLVLDENSFAFKDKQLISVSSDAQITAAKNLQTFIDETSGYKLKISDNKKASIVFQNKEGLNKEAYELNVTPKKITIHASDAAGYFYAVQTLKQLLSNQTSETANTTKYLVPSVTIKDSPRFK